MRIALYARVSTEEQAKHGISIDAQINALRSWAKAGNHEIVGEYVDAGISGKKPFQKRPELLRFIQQLEAGLSVDALVFCKLDRFYRSVKLYYQAVDILERHKVAWIAIQEDYETVTASGRFKVNIMLSVAENEADRTSERIKSVFEHKVNLNQPITGALPIGLEIKDKLVVPNQDAHIAVAVFDCYERTGSKGAVRDMLHFDYGIVRSITSVGNMLRNPLYKGSYRGNADFCEPIIPSAQFDRVQRSIERRATRRTPSGRVYLFSGLVFCKECGKHMSAAMINDSIYYRCPGHYSYKVCPNAKHRKESVIESAILEQFQTLVADMKVERPVKKKKPSVDKTAIQKKLERLKELYIDGDISKDKYVLQRDTLTAKLEELKPVVRPIPMLYGNNFIAEYSGLTRQKQKEFMRSVVDRIEIGSDGIIDIHLIP